MIDDVWTLLAVPNHKQATHHASHLMPEESAPLDQCHVNLVADIDNLKLIDSSQEILLVIVVVHTSCRVFFAEVSKVMHAQEIPACLTNETDIQAISVEEVLVLSINAAEPTVKLRRHFRICQYSDV